MSETTDLQAEAKAELEKARDRCLARARNEFAELEQCDSANGVVGTLSFVQIEVDRARHFQQLIQLLNEGVPDAHRLIAEGSG